MMPMWLSYWWFLEEYWQEFQQQCSSKSPSWLEGRFKPLNRECTTLKHFLESFVFVVCGSHCKWWWKRCGVCSSRLIRWRGRGKRTPTQSVSSCYCRVQCNVNYCIIVLEIISFCHILHDFDFTFIHSCSISGLVPFIITIIIIIIIKHLYSSGVHNIWPTLFFCGPRDFPRFF